MESELLPAGTGPSTGPEPDPPAAEGPWPLPRGVAMAEAQWDSAEPAAPERQNLLGLRRLQRHGQEQVGPGAGREGPHPAVTTPHPATPSPRPHPAPPRARPDPALP